MMRYALLLLAVFSFGCFAAADDAPIRLMHPKVNVRDRASVLRGAKFYAQNCMVCHSMRYFQHNKIASEAGITLDKMPLNNKNWWLGIVPPDLTLVARVRGPAWLYTYFHSFYKDADRPTGYNNLLVKNTVMANIFVAYQGEQNLVKAPLSHRGFGIGKPHYFNRLELVKQGTMTPEQFDEAMTDLVNFLVYASDPKQVFRHKLGVWVLLFLVILAVLAYFLKKLYWKDVKK